VNSSTQEWWSVVGRQRGGDERAGVADDHVSRPKPHEAARCPWPPAWFGAGRSSRTDVAAGDSHASGPEGIGTRFSAAGDTRVTLNPYRQFEIAG
jgi:hypothetical protein